MRAASFFLFAAAACGLAAPARGQPPTAPPPREINRDGSRAPAPQPEPPAKAENPAEVVGRIIKNSKDVGDRLAKTDTGTDTRGTQDKILKDIDALINRQEDPPPPEDKDKNDKNDKNDTKDMPPPMGGDMMGNMGMPMGGMGMQNGPPMGGTGDQQPKGGQRRPRSGDPMGGDKKDKDKGNEQPHPPTDKGKEQQGKGKGPDKDKGGKPGDPKEGGGATAGGNKKGGGKAASGLPFDEDVAKDVWGHLPDKLRQQMTQFYKDDVMPKYAELLKLYYSSLSERGQPPAPPLKK